MNTITTKRPVTGRILYIKYEVDALHWAVSCHLRTPYTSRSDTDTDYEEVEHIYNCHQGTEEETMTVPGDHKFLPDDHTYGLLDPDDTKKDLFVT